MVELSLGGLVCLVVAASCIAVAGVLTLFARIAASRKGAIGFFVLAVILLYALGGALLWVGFA